VGVDKFVARGRLTKCRRVLWVVSLEAKGVPVWVTEVGEWWVGLDTLPQGLGRIGAEQRGGVLVGDTTLRRMWHDDLS
jgi:hypothetical protein